MIYYKYLNGKELLMDMLEYVVLDLLGNTLKEFNTTNDWDAVYFARLVPGASVLKTICRSSDGHIVQEDFIQL
ncbi:MAG: hypothetical protein QXQ24_08355 [Nitrososphaeria archaeon]